MFWKRTPKITAIALAEAIQTEFVEKAPSQVVRILRISSAVAGSVDGIARTYAIASVLAAISRQDERNHGFASLRGQFERRVLPPHFSRPVLDEIKGAMKDLSALYSRTPERGEIRWDHTWVQRAGIEESSPVTLTLLALYWMDHHVAVSKMLKGCRIV